VDEFSYVEDMLNADRECDSAVTVLSDLYGNNLKGVPSILTRKGFS